MKLTPNFYRDRVCLNVLAGSKENAKEIYDAAEGHVLVGVLSKNYPDVDSAVADMRDYAALIDNALSVGLGAGDPNQSAMVSEISRQVQPQHVNQVFTGVGMSRALLGQNESVVNGLVSPTGTVGRVKISTGPLSSKAPDGIVPVETAIKLLKDMGGSSIKYFPMGGLECRDEFRERGPVQNTISGSSQRAGSIWKTTKKSSRSRWMRASAKLSRTSTALSLIRRAVTPVRTMLLLCWK
jgi:uncharacterized protein (TIGR03581 family)